MATFTQARMIALPESLIANPLIHLTISLHPSNPRHAQATAAGLELLGQKLSEVRSIGVGLWIEKDDG